MTHFNWRVVNSNNVSQIFFSDYTDTQPQASRLSLIFSIFVLVFSASSDRRALVRRNLRRPRAAAAGLTGPTGQPLSLSLLKPASQLEVLTGKSLWVGMDDGHMQQPSISPDHISIPPLHPLPPSLIPPHSISHSTNAAPINSPPRTTAPTAPSFYLALFKIGWLDETCKSLQHGWLDETNISKYLCNWTM